MLRIFDTLDAKKKEFVPVQEGKVGMYFCGMTVQSEPHVGHMRVAVVSDVFKRYLRYRGYDVTLIINFTDIDDKIIAKATEEGVTYFTPSSVDSLATALKAVLTLDTTAGGQANYREAEKWRVDKISKMLIDTYKS